VTDTPTRVIRHQAEAEAEAEVQEAKQEAQEEEAAAEVQEAEEEEEELYEVEINGIMYVTNDDEDGTIYSYTNEEVGDKIGEFRDKTAHILEGGNKGVYDKHMCKFDF
jgi:hypothetical protein